MIRKIGDKYIEFSIGYSRHDKRYDFKDPEDVLSDFIANVARVIPDANGEFCLVSCIVKQTAVELYGRTVDTNSCFTKELLKSFEQQG